MALLNSDTTESHLGPSTLQTFFDHEGGGPYWDVFFRLVIFRPTLGKFRGGANKKQPCI